MQVDKVEGVSNFFDLSKKSLKKSTFYLSGVSICIMSYTEDGF